VAAALAIATGGVVFVPVSVSVSVAGEEPSKAFNPEQIRKKMARVRAELQQKRREMERRGSQPTPARGLRPAPALRATTAEPGQNARAGHTRMQYRFVRGETAAYRVEIESVIENSRRSERFAGLAHITVWSVDPEGEAELFVIGKLECSTRSVDDEDGEGTPHPRRVVWLGSRVRLDPAGELLGKDDVNAEALPEFFRTLQLNPRRLLFPEIPRSVPGLNSTSGSAMLFGSRGGKSLLGPSFAALNGTSTRSLRADPLDPPMVRLQEDRGFVTDETVTPCVKLVYRAVSRFDLTRGRLVDTDATFRHEQDGVKPLDVVIRVRSLEGEEARRASEQARADWSERPDVLDPFEFRRVRVDAHNLVFLHSTREASPGMAVIHLRGSGSGRNRDADHRCYAADVVEADPAPNGEVTIRYRGSDEVLSVHPGTLALPPSAPGK
jgi:hypothetical protein